MAKQVHVMLERDMISLTGICRNCGPVNLAKNSNNKGGYVCGVGRNQQRNSNPERRKANRRSRHTGLRAWERLKFLEGKTCEICNSEERLAVDHDHATGEVRGALCTRCNIGIGYFKDSPDLLLAARQYLLDRLP